ncbi:RNA polymerase-binding transcription factor DksA [Rubricella aquisinus]|uniref:RNA polymerase-binding transcription factor DksA n=1 Tax=Rubricella aquisinus TaxID=2028108 RepID=A0A840X4B2_9RHOB|nr:TraR/DksA family transcriptional regulator [Rubricella aquisinus]MBB5515507.1 RNA polymerase-binding transcription factor DksA [Rubricella aquisinus]
MTVSEARRAELQKLRANLIAKMTEIEHELDAPHSQDSEDRATEIEGDEVLERLGTSAQAELRMIDAALDRIATGQYGYCTTCGEVISAERLDVLPFTPFCRTCAAAH